MVEQETDADAMSRKTILNLIYTNDMVGLGELPLEQIDLNFLEEHRKTDLDELISPLTCAAYLGRKQIVEMLLEVPTVDIDLVTQDNQYSPLSAASMMGHLEIATLLAENGADTNFTTELGQSPLVFCFSRMTETSNVFENKNICLRIANVLLKYGANVNKECNGRSILMDFCAVQMQLDPAMLEMTLEVIQFLLENGASPLIKCQHTGKNSLELAENHCASERILHLLKTTKQIYFHDQVDEVDCLIEEKPVNVGCCSLFACFN